MVLFLNRRTASRLTVGGGRGCRGSRRQADLGRRIDPAGVHAGGEAFGSLGIKISHPHDATERGLNVTRRATEPVIQFHMPEGRIEIITVKQSDSAPADPDAFRLAGSTVQQLGCLSNLVHLLGAFRLGRRLTLIAGFWFLSSGERSRKKQSRYARGARDQTHPDGSHGCSNLLGPDGPIIPLMRPGLAGICGVRRLGRSCWCDAPAFLADSIKAAARFIANMLRKIFPLGISVWALH
jgi:hypothetical protein